MDSRARKIFQKFPRDVKEYFQEIDKKCQKYSITFKIGGGKSVNSGCGRSGGYFDDASKVLAVAIGCSLESALSILIHEQSHLCQWKNPKSVWKNRKIYNGYTRFFRYLAGQKIYKKETAVQSAIELEKECEKLAIREIKKRWLKYINLENYKKGSNAYLFSYLHMGETGKWPVNTPCDRKILAHCPTELLRSYKRIPVRLKMAFDKYL